MESSFFDRPFETPFFQLSNVIPIAIATIPAHSTRYCFKLK